MHGKGWGWRNSLGSTVQREPDIDLATLPSSFPWFAHIPTDGDSCAIRGEGRWGVSRLNGTADSPRRTCPDKDGCVQPRQAQHGWFAHIPTGGDGCATHALTRMQHTCEKNYVTGINLIGASGRRAWCPLVNENCGRFYPHQTGRRVSSLSPFRRGRESGKSERYSRPEGERK